MTAIIGAVLLFLVVIMSVALIFGAPLGAFTMGGKFKAFTGKLRLLLSAQLLLQVFFAIVLLQVFFAVILLQLGGYMSLWFSHKVTKIVGIAFAVYLTLNCFGNMFSKSKKEKFVMTPLSVITAVCYWVNALAF